MSGFKVLKTYKIKSLRTVHEYIELVICPRCKEEFARHIISGSRNSIDPEICPKCSYPLKIQLEDIQLEDEDINPSKR
jgi:hypothetical protein